MDEIKLNMENLSKEEREQLLELVEKANKKESKVWKLLVGEKYNYITASGEIVENVKCLGYKVDYDRYRLGNCFKTQEEAEFALEKQKVIVELERFAKEHNETNRLGETFILTLNNYTGRIDITCILLHFGNSVVRFSSADIAKQAVEKIGADRLIKYYFGVKD